MANNNEQTPEYKFIKAAGLTLCGIIVLALFLWSRFPAQPGLYK